MATWKYESKAEAFAEKVDADKNATLREILRKGDDGDGGRPANEVYNLSPTDLRRAVDEDGLLDREGMIEVLADLTGSTEEQVAAETADSTDSEVFDRAWDNKVKRSLWDLSGGEADEYGGDGLSVEDFARHREAEVWRLERDWVEDEVRAVDPNADQYDPSDLTDDQLGDKLNELAAKAGLGEDDNPLDPETILEHKKADLRGQLAELGMGSDETRDMTYEDLVHQLDLLGGGSTPDESGSTQPGGGASAGMDPGNVPGADDPSVHSPRDPATGPATQQSSGSTDGGGGPDTATGAGTGPGAGSGMDRPPTGFDPTVTGADTGGTIPATGTSTLPSSTGPTDTNPPPPTSSPTAPPAPDMGQSPSSGPTPTTPSPGGSGPAETGGGETVDVVFTVNTGVENVDTGSADFGEGTDLDFHRSENGDWYDGAGHQVTDEANIAALDAAYEAATADLQEGDHIEGTVDAIQVSDKTFEEAVEEARQSSQDSDSGSDSTDGSDSSGSDSGGSDSDSDDTEASSDSTDTTDDETTDGSEGVEFTPDPEGGGPPPELTDEDLEKLTAGPGTDGGDVDPAPDSGEGEGDEEAARERIDSLRPSDPPDEETGSGGGQAVTDWGSSTGPGAIDPSPLDDVTSPGGIGPYDDPDLGGPTAPISVPGVTDQEDEPAAGLPAFARDSGVDLSGRQIDPATMPFGAGAGSGASGDPDPAPGDASTAWEPVEVTPMVAATPDPAPEDPRSAMAEPFEDFDPIDDDPLAGRSSDDGDEGGFLPPVEATPSRTVDLPDDDDPGGR